MVCVPPMPLPAPPRSAPALPEASSPVLREALSALPEASAESPASPAPLLRASWEPATEATATPWNRRWPRAETVNFLTHGLAFLLCLPASGWLLAHIASRADGWTLAGYTVYACALTLLYAASALSHAFERQPGLRTFFRIADQVCIYLLIAGTFTPFAVAHLRTPFGLAQLAAMWLLSALGIVLCLRGRGATVGWLTVLLCLLAGWIPILSIGTFLSVGGVGGMALIVAGGLFYSGGTLFLLNDHRHPYLHGVWHLMTIAGSTCHYLFLLNYVVG